MNEITLLRSMRSDAEPPSGAVVAAGRQALTDRIAGRRPTVQHRWRSMSAGTVSNAVVTSAVLAGVIAVSVLAMQVHPAGPQAQQAPGRAVGTSPSSGPYAGRPVTSGEVLARLSSADGATQTRRVAADGRDLVFDYTCEGAGTLAIHVPGDFDESDACGTGPGSVGKGNAVTHGTVQVRVRASDPQARWTITITAH
jgi:hypothetical protein